MDDVAIVGGGLSGLLTAWRVLHVNPDAQVTVYESKDHVGGNQTWSFNESDVPTDLREWLSPLVRHRWDRHWVKFPERKRPLDIVYQSGDSDALRAAIAPLRESGRLNVRLNEAVDPKDVKAGVVLDARGFQARDDTFLGYQKFVGRTIKTKAPHGLVDPVIMDATVEQFDGYRFMYLLPFSENELLVEDTYFSSGPHLSENEIGARIDDYIRDKGWSDHVVIHNEKGVLPMTTATNRDDDALEIGLRGGLVVSATGFTVPHAVEMADVVAQAYKRGGAAAVGPAVRDLKRRHYERERYARLLNRMFFHAGKPDERYVILQRFYGLREGLIRRFYRNELTVWDKARILIGKPPVPVTSALYNLSEKAFIDRQRKIHRKPVTDESPEVVL